MPILDRIVTTCVHDKHLIYYLTTFCCVCTVYRRSQVSKLMVNMNRQSYQIRTIQVRRSQSRLRSAILVYALLECGVEGSIRLANEACLPVSIDLVWKVNKTWNRRCILPTYYVRVFQARSIQDYITFLYSKRSHEAVIGIICTAAAGTSGQILDRLLQLQIVLMSVRTQILRLLHRGCNRNPVSASGCSQVRLPFLRSLTGPGTSLSVD